MVVIHAGGTDYEVYDDEGNVARRLENNAPANPDNWCGYWKDSAAGVRGGSEGHMGAFTGERRSSNAFVNWASARANEACEREKRVTLRCGTRGVGATKYLKDSEALVEASRFGGRNGCGGVKVPPLDRWDEVPADQFPAGTPVKVLTRPPTTDGRCIFACVDVGEVPRSPLPALTGTYLVPLAALVSNRPAGSSPEDRAEKQRAMTEEEIQTGRCSDLHVAQLRLILDAASQFIDATGRSNPRDLMEVTSHDLVVATREGVPLSLAPGAGGEFHLIAVGSNRSLSLEVADENGYAVSARSAYGEAVGRLVQGDAAYDTRVVRINTREVVSVTVKGAGCTLVIAARKF
jgi:hypothetical protein